MERFQAVHSMKIDSSAEQAKVAAYSALVTSAGFTRFSEENTEAAEEHAARRKRWRGMALSTPQAGVQWSDIPSTIDLRQVECYWGYES